MRNVLLPLAMSLDLDPLGWENLWKFAVRFFYVEKWYRLKFLWHLRCPSKAFVRLNNPASFSVLPGLIRDRFRS